MAPKVFCLIVKNFQSFRTILFDIIRFENGIDNYFSTIAQLVERMTVNHDVTGSSPVGGVVCVPTPEEASEHYSVKTCTSL